MEARKFMLVAFAAIALVAVPVLADDILDESGQKVGSVDPAKTNCIGYACKQGGSLDPVLEPESERTSLQQLFTTLGYKCEANVSALQCKERCDPNEYMMLYVYIMKQYDFAAVRRKYAGKDPFSDPIISSSNELDYHGLRGGEDGYTYQSHRDTKANEKIKKFEPTEAKPDYFGNAQQLLGKYCCCKLPPAEEDGAETGGSEEQGGDEPGSDPENKPTPENKPKSNDESDREHERSSQ